MNTKNIPKTVILFSVLSAVCCAMFAYFVLDGIPHIHDEVAYVFQAKIFSLGHVKVESPCAREAFIYPHVINNEKWYSQYPPGFPILLLPWVILNVPWLLNPILQGLSIFLFYLLGKEIFGLRVGIIASMLGALSIWIIIMSSTMMAHTSGMFFTTLFILGMFKWKAKQNIANAVLIGISLGMVLLIRPYTAFLIVIPFGIFVLISLRNNFKNKIKSIALIFLIFTLFFLVLALYNQITNGNPLRLGYVVRYGVEHNIGFGNRGYTDIAHSPYLGMILGYENLVALNKILFGWPFTSFWFLVILFLRWKKYQDDKEAIALLLSFVIVLFWGHVIYWAFSVFIGPRFLFESVQVLIVLSAKGIFEFWTWLSNNAPKGKVFVLIIGILFFGYSFVYTLPRWIQSEKAVEFVAYFDERFQGVTANIERTLEEMNISNSIVLIKMIYSPMPFFEGHWWGSGFIFNDPQLKRDRIYADGQAADLEEIVSCYPERDHYLYVGNLFRGMLLPVERKGSSVVLGQPLEGLKEKKKRVDIISNIREFFFIYSEQFGEFIDTEIAEYEIMKFNVPYILEQGMRLEKQKEWRKAAFYFEAALQLEVQINIRFIALNHLATCYTALGDKEASRIIKERLMNTEELPLTNVLPSRGF